MFMTEFLPAPMAISGGSVTSRPLCATPDVHCAVRADWVLVDMEPMEEPDSAMPDMPGMAEPEPAPVTAEAGYVAARRRAHTTPAPAPAVRAGRRRTRRATGEVHPSPWGTTVGTMARASTATSGPVFGSVPDPVRTPPTPCPVSQKNTVRTKPAARNPSTRRKSSGPKATTRVASASSQLWVRPPVPNQLPT